jgi:ATP-binding cassette subfamily B (MDR/TAP) protein 1
MAMLERYENVISIPATRTAGYVNEIIDAIKTVAALGRERETLRVYHTLARSIPTKNRYLLLGAGGFAVGQAGILLAASLNFYWMAQRLARGAVSVARHRFRLRFAHPVPLI